jgi:carnitine-CoA ligase
MKDISVGSDRARSGEPAGFAGNVLVPMAERTMVHALRRQVARRPHEVAIRDSQSTFTYEEAADRVRELAYGIAALGVEAGDTVATMLDNHADHLLVALAIATVGATEVTVNTAYKGSLLEYILADSQAKVAIVESSYLDRVDDSLGAAGVVLKHLIIRGHSARTPTVRCAVVDLDSIEGQPVELPEPQPQATAVIMYTSGTTGPAKGVRLPHAQIYTCAWLHPQSGPGDVLAVTVPLFHIAGRCVMAYNSIVHGAQTVVRPRFDAPTFLDDVRRYGCTMTLFVAGMPEMLLKQPARPDDREHSLRLVQLFSLSPDVELFMHRFGVPSVITGYGGTEVGSVCVTDAMSVTDVHNASPGLCGRPFSAYFDVELVDELDAAVPLGEVGEMVIRPKVPWILMNGYLGRPEATAAAWRNLWWHTGDTFRRGPDGEFYFAGRSSDTIRRRGENISVFELERQILAAPQIDEVAVVPVASEVAEDEIKAVVTLCDGQQLDYEAFIIDLAGSLPYFMVPRYIEVVKELPKNFTGKIKRAELRKEGVTATTWDARATGIRISRHGVVRTLSSAVMPRTVRGGCRWSRR